LTVAVIVHRRGREITAGNADVQRNMGIGARQRASSGKQRALHRPVQG